MKFATSPSLIPRLSLPFDGIQQDISSAISQKLFDGWQDSRPQKQQSTCQSRWPEA